MRTSAYRCCFFVFVLAFSAGANAATVQVVGATRAEVTTGGARVSGYSVTAAHALTVHLVGPGRVLVRALAIGRAEELTVTLERDGLARSVNLRPVVRSRDVFHGSPLSRPVNVELEALAGKHDYRIRFSSDVFVQVEPARASHLESTAASEEPLAPAAGLMPVALTPDYTTRTVEARPIDSAPPVALTASTESEAAAGSPDAASAGAAVEQAVFLLSPIVGMGFVVEDALGQSTPQFVFGADARYFLSRKSSGDMGLNLTVRDHTTSEVYLTNRPDFTSGGAASVSSNEQLLQLDLDFVYDFRPTQRLWLGLFAGPGLRFFVNQISPGNVGGIYPGGELRFALTDSLEVRARVSYLYNIFFQGQNSGSISALGPPHAAADASAGLALKVGAGDRLRLEYEGEDDAFTHSYRYYHSLCVLLDLAI